MRSLRCQGLVLLGLFVLILFVLSPLSGALADEPPPPPPPGWNPEWPWEPYGFWNPDDPLNPWNNPEYDPSTVPPHLWDPWWTMYQEWYNLNSGEQGLNCDVVYFEDLGIYVIVQNDQPDDEARRIQLRGLTRMFIDHLIVNGTGDLHDAWVNGDIYGLEIDFFHPPEGGPSASEVYDVVGAVMGLDADGEDMLLAYLYGYDEDGFDSRRLDVEAMIGHVMDDYRVSPEDASADTRVRTKSASARNKNYGSKATMKVNKAKKNRSMIAFDKDAIEDRVDGGTLQRAVLRVYIDKNLGGWGSNGRGLSAHRIEHAWVENAVTWKCPEDTDLSNNSPDGTTWNMTGCNRCFDTTATATVTITNLSQGWIELDVTDDVKGWLDGTLDCEGWLLCLENESKSGSVRLETREGATGKAPQLRLELLED